MNAKISVFVIGVEVIKYWLLYNLHDCTFKFLNPSLTFVACGIAKSERCLKLYFCRCLIGKILLKTSRGKTLFSYSEHFNSMCPYFFFEYAVTVSNLTIPFRKYFKRTIPCHYILSVK